MEPLCDKRRKMVEENMKLAYYFANNYMRHFKIGESHRDELGSCAILGLMKATRKFDPKKGKLVTWAWQFMRNELDQYRVGLWLWPLKGPSGRPWRVFSKVGTERFIEVPLKKDGIDGLESVDRIDASFEIIDGIMERDKTKFMYRMIDTVLSPRESMIMRMRLKGVTLVSIGEVVGVCRERVRQIERSSTRKLKLHVRTLAPV